MEGVLEGCLGGVQGVPGQVQGGSGRKPEKRSGTVWLAYYAERPQNFVQVQGWRICMYTAIYLYTYAYIYMVCQGAVTKAMLAVVRSALRPLSVPIARQALLDARGT